MTKLAGQDVLYRERVLPTWSSFLPLFLVYPTFWLTMAPFNATAGSITGLVATAAIVLVMVLSSPTIVITASDLRVSRARISIKLLGAAEKIEKSEQFAARGRNLDARAYLALQYSVAGLIRLQIKDTKDPTPYWLFSTRKPNVILELLSRRD